MPQAMVTLPDGQKARVTFTDKAQLDATVDDLVTHHQGMAKDALGSAERFIGEPLMKAATGAGASAVGAIRGLGAGAAALAAGEGKGAGGKSDAFLSAAEDEITQTQQALTYEPRTPEGKAGAKVAGFPFKLIGELGGAVAEPLRRGTVAGLEKLGAPTEAARRTGAAVGTVANLGVQAAPAVAGGAGLRLLRSAEAESAPLMAEEGAPRSAPTPEPENPPGATPGAAAGPAGPVPRETPQPPPAAGEPPELTRAKAYAGRIGLDWARLGVGTRKALQSIAKDATALDRLDPAAVKRQAVLGRFRVPIATTRGNLTRNPVELRREAIASRTTAGQPIRDLDVGANRDLQANLEILRGRVARQKGGLHEATEEELEAKGPSIRAPTAPAADVGTLVQKGSLGAKMLQSKRGYDTLYKKARETEPTAEAGLKPVTDLLEENPDIQHLGWVQGWINKARAARAKKQGVPISEVSLDKVTLNELDDLRKLSQKHGQGTDAHYAAELRKSVDLAMQDVPAGAKAWKEAIGAFKKHQAEFKDQGIIRKFVSVKKGTSDPSVALEKTVDTIHKASLEDVRRLKTSMLTGGTRETRAAGKKAWAAVRGETVNRILEDARNVVATDEAERSVLTAAALRKSISRIGRPRLNEILGPRTTQELYDSLRAAQITRTQPSARVTESGTVPNALIMAEKILSHIPGGRLLTGIAKGAKHLHDVGGAAGVAERAATTPLEQAAKQSEARAPTLERLRDYKKLEGGE
jgi:hypothetical protein